MIDQSGNKDGVVDENDMDKGLPKGKKNKDLTTRYLVEEGKGDEIMAKVNEAKGKLIAIYEKTLKNEDVLEEAKLTTTEVEERMSNINTNITLGIDDSWKGKSR